MANATSGLSIPGKFSLVGDTEQSWKVFKQKFNLYLLAAGFKKRSEEEKVALLLTLGGDELIEIYNSFEFPTPASGDPDPSQILKNVLEKFDGYFSPRKNVLVDRYKFRKCIQRADETLDSFITRIKIIIKQCDYGQENDNELRDQLVFGCNDDTLREKFFKEDSLTLDKAIKLSIAHQATKKQMSVFREEARDDVNKIGLTQKSKPRPTQRKPTSKNQDFSAAGKELKACKFCGNKHIWKRENCPAYGKTCNSCSGENHFASMCPKAASKGKRVHAKKKVNAVIEGTPNGDDGNTDSEFIFNVFTHQKVKEKKIIAPFEVSGVRTDFQID